MQVLTCHFEKEVFQVRNIQFHVFHLEFKCFSLGDLTFTALLFLLMNLNITILSTPKILLVKCEFFYREFKG